MTDYSPDVLSKASKLIADNAVDLVDTYPDGSAKYQIGTRHIVVDHNGAALCSCPARTRCKHQAAAQHVHNKEHPPMTTHTTPDSPSAPAPPQPDQQPPEPEQPEIVDPTDTTLAVPNTAASIDVATEALTWNTLVAVAETEFVPKALRGRPAAILAAIRLGGEYGLGPFEALGAIDVIDGSPNPSAELQMRLYRRAGHRLEVHRADDRAVEITGTRGDTGETMTVAYTLDDALAAGLIDRRADDGRPIARSKSGRPMPWELHTADLLWARAITRLCRRLAPDIYDRTVEEAP